MLKKLRVVAALLFFAGITLLFLDLSGTLHHWLGWMAKIQFLPAVMAVNAAVVVALVLLTLVFGRVYCSVICPLGVLQDGISHIGTLKKKAPYKYHKELKWFRYGIWVLFAVVFVLGIQAAVALLAPYSAFGRIVQGFRHPVMPGIAVAVVTLLVVAAFSLKGGRTYCNSICPVGTTLSFFSRFAMFRPVIDTEKCKHCKACELHCKAQCISISKEEQKIDYSRCVDCFNCLDTCKFGALKYRFAWGAAKSGAQNDKGRRAFMTGTALAIGTAALKGVEAKAQGVKKVDGGFAEVLPKEAPERDVPLTPPGSRSVKDFYRRCTACQLCVSACPNKVLRPSTRAEHFMQPEMSYEKGFCRPECTRCSEVCPSGAILKVTREEKTQYHIGTAHVDVEACLSATGKSSCGKCAQICPSGAIMMVGDPLRPAVNEEICIGCGACEQYCPVRPLSAITVNGREEHV